MKNKIALLILTLLIILSILLASCGTKTTPTTTNATTSTSTATVKPTTTTSTTKTPTQTTTTAEEPQYGGQFTYRLTSDFRYLDPYWSDTTSPSALWYETLCTANLSVDRNIYDFKQSYLPVKYMTGELAENWEISADSKTITFHIREGIHWQDMEPVNGREFNADDVVWNFNRQLGLGSGFTTASPNINAGNYSLIESVTATDKYTVVFQLKSPSLDQVFNLMDDHWVVYTVAREAVEKWGDVNDWKHQIGTGPFILNDYVSSSSLSLHKNPNYWAQDFANPQNKLPYIDNVKVLIIPDLATALAALRTGKIDLIEDIIWQQAASITKTNPELLQVTRPTWAYGIFMLVDRKPYSDIRVRQAMQMAIDLPTIAKSYYGGLIDGKPMGLVGLQGYYTPFDQWPQEIKNTWLYNPEGAKKLLADAGYPEGFKATLAMNNAQDIDLVQILKAYLLEIGIDMNILPMDPVSYSAYKTAGKNDLTFERCTVNYPPVICLNPFFSETRSYSANHVKDPVFEDLRNRAKASFNEEEQRNLVNEADNYAIKQQWSTNVPPAPVFCVYQPWLKRFNGEVRVTSRLSQLLWIDQTLKKSMGR